MSDIAITDQQYRALERWFRGEAKKQGVNLSGVSFNRKHPMELHILGEIADGCLWGPVSVEVGDINRIIKISGQAT